MSQFKKKILVLLVVLAAATAITILLNRPQKVSLTLTLSPADTHVTAGGTILQAGENKLIPGSYTLTATKDGYLTQNATVQLTTGKDVDQQFSLKQKTVANTVEQVVLATVYKASPGLTLTVLKSKAVYDNEWIVARVKGNSDPGTVILKRDQTAGGYSVYVGPASSLDPDYVQQLPPDVQSAITEVK